MITLETLKQFCGEEQSRPELMTPWTWGEYTYASDGRILIRVPKRDDVPVSTGAPKHQLRVDELFSRSVDGFEPPPSAPDAQWGKPCVHCGGTGRTRLVVCDCCESAVELSQEIQCEECDGGRVLRGQQSLFGHHFLNHFYLAKIQLLPGAMLAANKESPLGEVAIRFDGGEGWLSPMREKD